MDSQHFFELILIMIADSSSMNVSVWVDIISEYLTRD